MKGSDRPPGSRTFPWRGVLVATVVAATVTAGGLLTRSRPTPSFVAGADEPESDLDAEPAPATQAPRINLADLQEVLRFGRLPEKLAFGGMPYEAITADTYGSSLKLTDAGKLPDGKRVYFEKRSPIHPYQTLYLRVDDGGSGSEVYVRYRLAPPIQLP